MRPSRHLLSAAALLTGALLTQPVLAQHAHGGHITVPAGAIDAADQVQGRARRGALNALARQEDGDVPARRIRNGNSGG